MEQNIKILEESIIQEKYHLYKNDLKKCVSNVIKEYKELEKENESLKLFVVNNPNMDVDSAAAYINLRSQAYIEGRAEERQKAEQLIYENYIPVSLVEETIKEYKKIIEKYNEYKEQGEETDVEFYENITNTAIVQVLQELLGENRNV